MANISSGTIVPYAKINDTWFKGSDLNDLMETLSEISYDSDGIINDNFIGICGRWSVYSTYHDYLIHWEVYKSLKKIMAQYSIQQLKIFYSDIEEGIGFMDFGEIVINYNDDDIIVTSDCYDFDSMEKSTEWQFYQNLLDSEDFDEESVIDGETLYDRICLAREDYFYELQEKYFNRVNI